MTSAARAVSKHIRIIRVQTNTYKLELKDRFIIIPFCFLLIYSRGSRRRSVEREQWNCWWFMEPHNVRWWQLLESHLVFITRHFDPTLKKPIMTNWCWSCRQKSGDIEKGKWKRQQRSLLSWISGEGRGLAGFFWCLLTTVITELCFFTAWLWLNSHISILIMVDLVKVIVKPHFLSYLGSAEVFTFSNYLSV